MIHAHISHKQAFLNSDFGLQLAMKKFEKTEAEIEEIVGRYVRGKRKGELRGILKWQKVERGGWIKTAPGYMEGFLCRFKVSFDYSIENWDGDCLASTSLWQDNGKTELEKLVGEIEQNLKG